MRTRLTLISGLVLAVILATLPLAVPTRAADLQAALQRLADDAVREGLVGVSIAIYTPEAGIVLAAAGVSDKTTRAALTTSDVGRIASCSKVWVGAAVMQLIGEGTLGLDDPIAPFLGADDRDHIANAKTATVGQLLSHTSGIFDYFNSDDFGMDDPNKMDFTLAEALRYAWDKPAEFPAGTAYAYSNTNTVLLGVILEKVTGQPYAQVLRSRIFTPLGLKHTYIEVFEPVPVRIARGYEDEGDEMNEIGDSYQGGGLPDGGIVTTAEDMALFMKALFVDGTLLDAGLATLMTTPVTEGEDGEQVGYHIFISQTDHGLRYEHDGSLPGYLAVQMQYPKSGVILAMWTNSGGETAETVFFDDLQAAVIALVHEGTD